MSTTYKDIEEIIHEHMNDYSEDLILDLVQYVQDRLRDVE